MGNCLVHEEKVTKIMRVDGEMLQYPSPFKVQQVLKEFPGHMISDELPVVTHLHQETLMSHRKVYYLLPPQQPVAVNSDQLGVVRIKLVLTKQELRHMLGKGGLSPDDMLSFLKRERSSRSEKERPIRWRPILRSIPEGDDSARF